jgi:hypothetical protein
MKWMPPWAKMYWSWHIMKCPLHYYGTTSAQYARMLHTH